MTWENKGLGNEKKVLDNALHKGQSNPDMGNNGFFSKYRYLSLIYFNGTLPNLLCVA